MVDTILSWFEPGEQVLRLASVLRECRPSGPSPSSVALVLWLDFRDPSCETCAEPRDGVRNRAQGYGYLSMLLRFQSCRFVQLAGRIPCHWPERFPSSKSGLRTAGRPPLALFPVPLEPLRFGSPPPHAMPDFGSRLPCIAEQTHKFTSREIWMRPFFLPRAFSAEMQLTRSQEASRSTPTTSRESFVAGCSKKRAQATRPSSRLLPARDEVLYLFRTASTQAHRMPQTSSIWDKTHGCTMVSVSQALRRRPVEIRTAARPPLLFPLPAVSKTADPSFRKPFRPSRLYSHPLPLPPQPAGWTHARMAPPPVRADSAPRYPCVALHSGSSRFWQEGRSSSLSRETGIRVRVNIDQQGQKKNGVLSWS